MKKKLKHSLVCFFKWLEVKISNCSIKSNKNLFPPANSSSRMIKSHFIIKPVDQVNGMDAVFVSQSYHPSFLFRPLPIPKSKCLKKSKSGRQRALNVSALPCSLTRYGHSEKKVNVCRMSITKACLLGQCDLVNHGKHDPSVDEQGR